MQLKILIFNKQYKVVCKLDAYYITNGYKMNVMLYRAFTLIKASLHHKFTSSPSALLSSLKP